jgi:putative PIN family toxin of toxin-antitoxin system
MRVVVDTNVFISAALKEKSVPARAVRLVEQIGVILKSAATEQQLRDFLGRPYFLPLIPHSTRAWLNELMTAAETVPITERVRACRDSTDAKFLELAINGRADLIVSGDADLLVLNPFRGIAIMTPAAFVHSAAP